MAVRYGFRVAATVVMHKSLRHTDLECGRNTRRKARLGRVRLILDDPHRVTSNQKFFVGGDRVGEQL